MNSSPEQAAPPKPRPRPWYRLHCSTWLAALAVAGVLATLNLSGFIRIRGNNFLDVEWQNGWPGVYLQRKVERAPPAYDHDDPFPTKVLVFRPVVLAGDAALALAAVVGIAWLAERRRRRRGHPFQYRLPTLFAVVFLIAAALGWERFQQRRQERAADELLPVSFGYVVDQGTPSWLRRRLPGGKLRPFDRITYVELVGPECVGERLAPLALLRHVKQIKFISNALDDEGLSHVRDLTGLVCLEANYCRITDRGLAHLAALTRMRSLDISSDEGITGAGLVQLERMRRLEVLRLSSTSLTNAALASLRGLASLKQLDLRDSAAIGDDGLVHVAVLEQLEILTIAGTNVTDAGLQSLRGLNRLKLLDLRNTRVTAEGASDLQRALPNCRIVR